MKALVYLLFRTIWNTLKSIVKKPLVLIPYLVFIGLLIFSTSMSAGEGPSEVQHLDGYAAVVNGVFLLIFILCAMQGLKQGTAIFSMADVNFLFTSPTSSRKVLIYGIVRQAGILVLASVCMLAQYSNLRMICGLGGEAVAGLMLGYIFMGVFSQILSANLYAFCASNPQWRKRIDAMLKGFLVVLCAGVVYFAMQGGDILAALTSFFGHAAWDYVPVFGFCRAIALYAAVGSWGTALIYSALMLLCCGGLVIWLVRSDADYYEDVLFAAEHAHSVKEAAKEGRMVSGASVSKRVKRALPPLKGNGASAFFFRSLREQSRRGLWLFSLSTFAALGGPILSAVIFSVELAAGMDLWPVLYFTAYLMVFFSMTNSASRELTQHYIFIAPASAMSKLIAASVPQLIKYAADAVVFFAAVMLLIRPALIDALGASLVYLSLGAVFTAGVLLVERLLGKLRSKTLIVLLYFVILIILVLPGMIVGGLVAGILAPVLGFLLAAGWNVLMSLVIIVLCRGLLNGMAQ